MDPPSPSVESCGKCDRKILIERALIGTDHTMGILVTCGRCVLKADNIMEKGTEIYGEEIWTELMAEMEG